MKPAAFELHRPGSIEEAVGLLEADRDVKVLAGGQSLIPLLNFRLAQPEVLVDINHIDGLEYVREKAAAVHIGALTRQRALERSGVVGRLAPLLAEAVRLVAHAPIRNRGTLGGSLAHADAASELCAAALALEATMVAQSQRGSREMAAGDFFVGPLTTALAVDELLTEVRIPALPRGSGCAFEELACRKGDFAMVGVAAVLGLDADSRIVDARLAYASMGPTPRRAQHVEDALLGKTAGEEVFRAAADLIEEDLDPSADIHASRRFRLHAARVLTGRALAAALERTA